MSLLGSASASHFQFCLQLHKETSIREALHVRRDSDIDRAWVGCRDPSGLALGVVAVDIQGRMLQMLRDRVEEKGLTNVELVLAGLGEGRPAANEFDIALLVTVLGEIPDKVAALREIYQCLRPGGVLSITEVLPDPHYQGLSRVRRLVVDSGFHELAISRDGCPTR